MSTLSFAEYVLLPGINGTSIKAGETSMKHMHHVMTGGDRKDTTALSWGRIVHSALLEPEAFMQLVSVFPGKTRRGNEWEAFRLAHNPDYILKGPEYNKLMEMIDAVHANPAAASLINTTEHEVSLTWEDDQCGLCKARLDMMGKGGLGELKTTSRIQKSAFERQALSLGYLDSLGWYWRGVIATTGKSPSEAHFLVVESDAPYDSAVYRVNDGIVREYAERAAEVAHRYRVHEHCGSFPGVCDGVADFELPAWASGVNWNTNDIEEKGGEES